MYSINSTIDATYKKLKPKLNLVFIIFLILIPLAYLIPAYIKYGFICQNDVVFPLKFYFLNSIKNPEYLHWTPNILSGIPFWSNIQNIVSPIDVIFFIFPFKFSFNFVLILIVILNGIFSYLYLKSLDLQHTSCFFGALVYQLSGFSLINIWVGHEYMVLVYMWAPLILMNLELYLKNRNPKYLIFIIIVFLFQLLIGYIQSLLILTLFYYTYLLFRINISSRDWLIKLKTILKISISFLIAIGLSMFKYFPAFYFIKQTDVAKGIGLDFFFSYSLPIPHVLTFLFPKFFGDTSMYWGKIFGYKQFGNYHEFILYVGFITLIISTISILLNRNRFTRFIFICFLITIILSFGKFGYVYYIFRYIPFFRDFRGPTKFVILIPLYFSIFSAYGTEFLLKNKINAYKKIVKTMVIILIIMLLLIAFLFLLLTYHEDYILKQLVNPVSALLNRSYDWVLKNTDPTDFLKTNVIKSMRSSFGYSLIMIFITLILLITLYMKRFGKKLFIIGSAIFLIFDSIYLTIPNFYNINNKINIDNLTDKNQITQLIENDKDIYRVQAASYEATGYLNLNKSLIFNFEDINGYYLFTLKRYMEFIRAVNKESMDNYSHYNYLIYNFDSKLINLLNVKYVLSEKEISSARFKKILNEPINVYQNTEYLPRFFDLYNFKVLDNPISRFNYLSSQEFDPTEEAILEENIKNINLNPKNKTRSANIKIIDYKPNYIKLSISSKEDFILGSSMVYYPEWKAYLDNKSIKTYYFDHTFQAFAINSGTHIFELKYIPTSFYKGSAISLISLVIMLFYYLSIKYFKFIA